ncbi:hypothetical protein ABGB12_28315 [Actinocorallia sp. B10E7]|uniref:GNAT family N-acetyltransferase n=1 Tax=Actinocorallia sp. B10E7 TaxID=3153558 RepID=UPI00325D6F7E
MIRADWRGRPAGEELKDVLEFVRICSEFDEDAGFTRVGPGAVEGAGPHLLVRRESGGPPVAYVRFAREGGEATASLVVHPDVRSTGVATALLELLGPDAGAWDGLGTQAVSGWADGHHPAAERLARRFGARVTGRIWRTLRPLTGPHARPSPDPSGGFVLTESPPPEEAVRLWRESGLSSRYRPPEDGSGRLLYAAEPGGSLLGYAWLDRRVSRVEGLRTGTIRAVVPVVPGRGTGLALASGALALLRDAGAQAAETRIDPELPRAVRMSRLLGFERTQDDVRYTLKSGF